MQSKEINIPQQWEELNNISNLSMYTQKKQTICKLRFVADTNSLNMKLPKELPDFNKIIKSDVYFWDEDNQIYFSLYKPNRRKWMHRKVQDSGSEYRSFFVPVPIQLRKKYKLDESKHAILTYNNDGTYLCQFNNGQVPNQTPKSTERTLFNYIMDAIYAYFKNEGGK